MNNCSCIYCDVDEGYVVTRKLVAIQDRTCFECKETIKTGEYYAHTIFWDYSYCDNCDDLVGECECVEPDGVYCTCLNCLSIVDVFFCNGYYFGRVLDALRCHIEDVGEAILSCNMSQLTKTARDRICDLIEYLWGERD